MSTQKAFQYDAREIVDDIHWLSICQELDSVTYEYVNEATPWYVKGRRIHNMYNLFLFKDDENLLLDSGPPGHGDKAPTMVDDLLDGEDLDYLVISHPDVDHTGTFTKLVERYPDVTLVAPKYGSTHEMYGLEAAEKVAEGDTIDLGEKAVRFHDAPFIDSAMTVWMSEEKSDSFFTVDWGGYLHNDDECMLFFDELREMREESLHDLALEERLLDYNGRTFFYYEWLDPDKVRSEIDHIRNELDPTIMAPSHGNIIRRKEDVREYLTLLKDIVQEVHERGRIGKQF